MLDARDVDTHAADDLGPNWRFESSFDLVLWHCYIGDWVLTPAHGKKSDKGTVIFVLTTATPSRDHSQKGLCSPCQ
jgi:hypothetical protein